MLKFKVFLEGYELLCDRFSVGMKDTVASIYHAILNQYLTDDQFRSAVLLSIQHDNFFPSPQSLVDRVLSTSHERALMAWQEVMSADPRQLFEWDDSVGWYALRLVGGLKYVHDCDLSRLGLARKEFIEAYEMRAARQNQLAPAEIQKMLGGSNG